MNVLILARALHVLAVVIWIGGVSIVTAVVLPAVRQGALGSDRLRAFEAIERRFVWIARSAVLLAGVTGFYLVARLELWGRFRAAQFWWMHAMVGVWSVFVLIVFLIEPLGLHHRVLTRESATLEAQLVRTHRVHMVLLALALVTIAGAVAGSHGWVF
jgi:uncharacterized membrane protein